MFITILVKSLQLISADRKRRSSLFNTTSSAYFKDKEFPGGECLHFNIKYSDQCIIYLPIKPMNMIHIKCALVFFNDCPEYNIPDEEPDDGPNS